MAATVAALDYLSHVGEHFAAPVCVVFGDETYLKRESIAALRDNVLSAEDADLSLRRADGSEAQLRDIIDELFTISMFGGGKRMVIVEDADAFVTRYRGQLEDYVRKPASSGILVLAVSAWPTNTRLYKLLADVGLQIDCKPPSTAAVHGWLSAVARKHGVKLAPGAGEQLLDVVGMDLGVLDQEVSKLALLAGSDRQITPLMIRDMVGGWRARTGWDMLDAACDGRVAEALEQLDRLIVAGEHPIAILGQVSYTLRMLARATRLYLDAEAARRSLSLSQALVEAGCRPHVVGKVVPQLKRLGRVRGGQVYRWLLEADLAMKGISSAPQRARLVLEKLIVRIATPEMAALAPRAAATSKAS